MNNTSRRITATFTAFIVFCLLGSGPALADSVFTISNPPLDYEVIDAYPFDGFGDFGPFQDSAAVLLGWTGEARFVTEFDISPFAVPPGEQISLATFQAYIASVEVGGMDVPPGDNPDSVALQGYVGNGAADLFDFEAGDGNYLGQVLLPDPYVGQQLTFDVTSFVTQLVNDSEDFAGLTVRAEEYGAITLFEGLNSPKLTIYTTAVPEPAAFTLLAVAGLALARRR
jgi:MYXO-CTERM domain-containing protein